MNNLKVNQIYKANGNGPDYGDLIRWKVTQLGKRCAVLVNCATLKEMSMTQDDIGEMGHLFTYMGTTSDSSYQV